ncbi:rRNA-processing protein FCF1 homolog [Zophobas morio]|jgi:U3 small nucleolar RNA-associated protein 24|uniref:rRNA-processing protein FCF1 homolog n=1 Tax=Zophobas morio TaxID=2755281 RepID=UPI0030827E3B
MVKVKRRKRFATVKRTLHPKDMRILHNRTMSKEKGPKICRNIEKPVGLFFHYNTQLGPPFRILLDTNFINFSIQNKLELVSAMMDCLLAKCIPCITGCVLAELEKLGTKYRVALRVAKDPRFERLCCLHKGTYADDCLVNRVMEHKCYIVATCDKELKRRIRKIPGIPIMSIVRRKYSIERMPDDLGATRNI